jgi:CRP/FNR family cyclic AMP-dependent transcriptional regulator
LIRQGEKAKGIYYIMSGTVRVVLSMDAASEKVLNVIGRGSCFGDWGVVNCKPRGASRITTSDVELLVIDPP